MKRTPRPRGNSTSRPAKRTISEHSPALEKSPTGIEGLDQVTLGGLPRGRATLVCGSPGCGKTLLGTEFLANGARKFGEPGVFVTFEETADELVTNASSLQFRLDELAREGKLFIEQIRIEPSEIAETGEYDLEGLFVRLRHAIETVKAKRIVLDTIEVLFSAFLNTALLRAEIRRLFQFLKSMGVTAIVTGERGENSLTRFGLEEYVADCVILLDHRIHDQVSTRRLRIVKYRGSSHGTNEYPFLIDEQGFSVLPVTSLGLNHKVSEEIVATGIPDLDGMLGVGGYYRGSSILVSGTAGTGKTSFCAAFMRAACKRGERALFLSFEESAGQIVRNMQSIGCNLAPHLESGLLRIITRRPYLFGLEMHLATIHKEINQFQPSAVVIDPISSMHTVGDARDANSMVTRLIDFLKSAGITGVMTSLTEAGGRSEATELGISSIMDTWLLLRDIEISGERNRGIYVLKARGMAHSNQIREFLLSADGIRMVDVYLGPSGMLTGSARMAQASLERDETMKRQDEVARKLAEIDRRRKVMEARIEAIKAEFEAEEVVLKQAISEDELREQRLNADRSEMSRSRRVNGRSGPTVQ